MTPNKPSEDHLVSCLFMWAIIMLVLVELALLFVFYTIPTIIAVAIFVAWICLSVERGEGAV
jgi:hypothetical protein